MKGVPFTVIYIPQKTYITIWSETNFFHISCASQKLPETDHYQTNIYLFLIFLEVSSISAEIL